MRGRIHMNVYPAGIIHTGACSPQFSHKLLYRLDIFVMTDWGNHFHLVKITCGSSVTHGRMNRCVADHLPVPPLPVRHMVCIIAAAVIHRTRSKICGDDFGCLFSGNSRHFHFDAESLTFQTESVLFPFFCSEEIRCDTKSRTAGGTCFA